MLSSLVTDSRSQMHQLCDQVQGAIDDGKMGDIVASHQKLILRYYQDVQDQAMESFATARHTAIIGFCVLIGTLLYLLIFDGLRRFDIGSASAQDLTATIGTLGTVSGALIEFTAAAAFWLYERCARQFGAFHICLERTHRYLIAYKIAQELKDNKDQTLHELACIMANAPMITSDDTNAIDLGRYPAKIFDKKASEAAKPNA